MVAGLPDLSFDDGKLSYSLSKFKSEIYTEISSSDRKIIDLFFLKIDNGNLLKLLKNKETVIDEGGNFTADELLSLIATVREGDKPSCRFPIYMSKYIEKYITLGAEELYGAEDMLAAFYYEYAINNCNKFVSAWFEFNLNLNNIFAAMTARKYDIDIVSTIVGNNEVAEKLRTSNARDFGLGEILEYFDSIQRIAETTELVERERKIDILKWNWMENATFFNYFTIERIFVFLLRIEMIERWTSMDKEKGSELFRMLIQSLKNDVQIPEEFK